MQLEIVINIGMFLNDFGIAKEMDELYGYGGFQERVG